MRKSRVLVVDDSASMRQLISAVLNAAPDLEVVGHAADPLEAREAIKSLSPDVVTLDVEMPNMNGIDFLERLMRLRPTPVIMVSSLTRRGGEVTTRALEIGAVDCVMKPALGDAKPFGDLAEKVRMAAGARLQPGGPAARQGETSGARMSGAYEPDGRIVAIGSSTGGVEALTAVLTVLPRNCAPVVVTQHMPPMFTRSFADRLDKLCAATVAEASDGAPLLPGHIYIAPGGAQHLEVLAGAGLRGEGTGALRCRLRQRPLVNGHCPSVDVLFHSVVKAAGPRAVGVILTGMGRDGAEGLLAMRQAGAATLGQDAASSLIYGMPKTAFEIGAVERQVPLKRIGVEIATMTNKSDRR